MSTDAEVVGGSTRLEDPIEATNHYFDYLDEHQMGLHALQKKDTSMSFWTEHFFSCHTYDTSMTIIVTKPGIIIDVVGSYFYDKKS